jgi:hypothetical protein
MTIKKLSFLALASFAAAAPTIGSSQARSLAPMISSISEQGGEPLTSQILQTFLEPFEINLDRNSYVYRDGSSLKLNGEYGLPVVPMSIGLGSLHLLGLRSMLLSTLVILRMGGSRRS